MINSQWRLAAVSTVPRHIDYFKIRFIGLSASVMWLLLPFYSFADTAAPYNETCTGIFSKLIVDAGNIKAGDIILARQMRLACLTIMQVVDSDSRDIRKLFCFDEGAQAREACKIADAVIETYESKKRIQGEQR